MRVLVIGGTQFIGPFVVRHLVGGGHQVAVFHRGRTEAELPAGVHHIHGERERMGDFSPAFREFAPEVVLDMRPFTEQDMRLTIDAVRGIAERLVAISSMDVYHAFGILTGFEEGALQPTPLTEDSPLREKLFLYRGMVNPRLPDIDHYDKIPIERLVLSQAGVPGTILRLPMVYGPGDGQHRLWPYLKRMDDGRPAILLGERVARRRFARSYVDNVGAAIALAATDERAAGRVYNLAEPEPLGERDWVALIARHAGWDGSIVVVPDDELPAHLQEPGNLDQDLAADSSRIRDELGYHEEIGRDEALARTIRWERENPPEHDPARFDYAAEDARLSGV